MNQVLDSLNIENKNLSSNSLKEFIKYYSLKAHELSYETRSSLYDFKMEGNEKGYLLFRGLDKNKSKESLISYGSLLGSPYSYIQEGNGEFFHEISPKKNFETEISSKSSKINLDFHTELCFHHFIPHYLLLFCVRGDRDHQAKTYVSSIRNSLSEIPLTTRKLLEEPLYLTGIDHSFGNVETIKGNGKKVAVLYGDLNDPLLNFDPDLMVATTTDADHALKKLRTILYKNKTSHVLTPGDLLIVDNLRAVHGRSAFKAYYDGEDRFLHRIFINRDLTRAEEIFQKKELTITYQF